MKYLCACLLGVTLVAAARADEAALREARTRELRGNYGEAQDQYEKLLKIPADSVPAALGLARVHLATGDYEPALKTLDAVLADHPKQAPLHALRAEVLFQRGRWDDAEKSAAAALTHDKNSLLAHWVLARLYRDRGSVVKAGTELLWFVRFYKERGNALADPDELLLVGQAGIERARGDSRLGDQFSFVLNEIYADALKRDKDFWPALYESGAVALEKYDFKKATDFLNKALVINPRAVPVLVAKGQSAFQRFEMKDAELFADRALNINPHQTAALRLKADVLLAAGDMAAARKQLEHARQVNPREEATLGRLAAIHRVQGDDAGFAALVAEAEKHNSRPSTFYCDLAERLEERRLHDDAEKYYKKAVELRPTSSTARNQLGLLQMRLGNEKDARAALEDAHKYDKFNVRVFNSLKVLDHLDNYASLKTPHFLLRYDPKNDKVLARFMAKYLEEIYADLAKQFDYEPKAQILIEVFHAHDMFSGRIIALPDLHTIGACTGNLVAMVSPRETTGTITKPFNWARVLKHELVHVFNLDQTKFKVPHWFTEGLAVNYEGNAMPPSWHQLLRERVTSGELLNLDNIQAAFVRPTSAEEWQLAYLQSLQYVRYLKEKHGPQAVGGFLKAFAAGKDTAAALEEVCKTPKAEFEKGYRAHLDKLVQQQTGKPPEKVLSFNELKKAQEAAPNDADLAAKLAERYLLVGNAKEAKRLAEAAQAARKNHPLASFVLARVLLQSEEDAKGALPVLEAAVNRDAPEVKVLKLLGKIQLDAKQYAKAAQTFELGRKAEPHEASWLTFLAQIYKKTNDPGSLADVLKDLVPLTPDDLAACRELAQLLGKAGKHAEAERFARSALEIDVLDRPAQEVLEAALQAQGKVAELKELREMLTP